MKHKYSPFFVLGNLPLTSQLRVNRLRLPFLTSATLCLIAPVCLSAPVATKHTTGPNNPSPAQSGAALSKPETLGGGSVADPAVGPLPSFGLGGPNMVLVKNWHFGTNGTIRSYDDMSANFFYHDQFGTINNGGKYGSNMVSPDLANATGGQPIEGVNSPPVRAFTPDSLKTFLTPLDKVTDVQVRNHNTGNGSFMAKWRLPTGGSLLGRDIVWETRVRYVPPPYFWFAIWTAGNKWKWDGQAQGAEQDLVESFGYDNGGGNTNYDGRFFHSNSVASPSKDDWNFWDWGGTMKDKGIPAYDASQYHIWTWVYKKDNSFAMYVDGIRVQGGKDYYWTFGNKKDDEPIDMDFLFDAGWGHNQIGSVNKELPASALDGKFYEWNYSRVYLSDGVGTPRGGPHILPGTIKAVDFNLGAKGIAYDQTTTGGEWHNYTVQVPAGGQYNFSFEVTSPKGGGTFHVEDENGANLSGVLTAPKTAKKGTTVAIPTPVTLSSGVHVLKLVQDGGGFNVTTMKVANAPGATAAFLKTDTKTQGNWKGTYGSDGFMIAADATKQPNYGKASLTTWTFPWSGSTSDVRGLQKAEGTDRVAGQWGSNDPTYDIDCNLSDDALHQVALYGIDWDRNGRSADIQVVDAASGKVLDSREIDAYSTGKYLVWNVQGHVIFRVKKISGWTNSAMSGLFFDPLPAVKPPKHA